MSRTTLLLLAALLCVVNGYSAIINVDNNPNRPSGYYASLPLAINAANAGDTLYIYPSNTSYGNITLDKQLHLFGSGFDGTTGNVSRLGNLTMDTATSNSAGSSIQGLTMSRIYCSKPNISQVVVSGNYFSNSGEAIALGSNCSGWLIANNLINGYVNVNYNSSILITNNIFKGSQDYPVSYSNSPGNVFSHNLCMRFRYFQYTYNLTITDNILICEGDNSTYNSKNRYYNNISWRSTLTPYVIPTEGSTGSGNFSNQDPQFETATASGTFDSSKDYRLKAASPGKNAATDGTDIGPYGGSKPFVWGGGLSIPQITETLVTNPVINQTTPLNVNVKGKSAAY